MIPFSVTISIYKSDNPDYFKMAMNSILNQTLPPDEIVLTIDGPISAELNNIAEEYAKLSPIFEIIRLQENRGLGFAHKIGVENCSNQLIAIMDSDDIAVSDRFEKQVQYLEEHPDVDIVGGYIYEFIDTIENIVGIRDVPLVDEDIKKYLKKRCPLNHVTVMFKKEAVLKCGNYQDWQFNEDYYLWCRMFLSGFQFGNIPDNLVYVRVGKDMYNRRGGWKYFKSEARLQKFMLDKKIINNYEYNINILTRFAVQIMLPNSIRGYIFRHFFRRDINFAY
ncbi:glycosyl transferase [Spirochaetia bacterium]|nr:glycosyl transferase [Spirochaetia bacterium]